MGYNTRIDQFKPAVSASEQVMGKFRSIYQQNLRRAMLEDRKNSSTQTISGVKIFEYPSVQKLVYRIDRFIQHNLFSVNLSGLLDKSFDPEYNSSIQARQIIDTLCDNTIPLRQNDMFELINSVYKEAELMIGEKIPRAKQVDVLCPAIQNNIVPLNNTKSKFNKLAKLAAQYL